MPPYTVISRNHPAEPFLRKMARASKSGQEAPMAVTVPAAGKGAVSDRAMEDLQYDVTWA